MRVLFDQINTITMTNEDSNYPIENSQTPYQGQVTKATGKASTFSLDINNNGNAIFLGNTNAETGVLRVYDPGLVETIPFVIDHRDTIIGIMQGTERQGFIEDWELYTYISTAHALEIDLTTTESILHIGIIKAGFADHFTNPNYGWSQNIIDTSIKNETNIGATYVLNRSKLREFSGDFIAYPKNDFYKFQDLYYKLQNQSTAFYFVDDGTSSRQMCFGKLGQPSSSFPSFEIGNWSINIREEL